MHLFHGCCAVRAKLWTALLARDELGAVAEWRCELLRCAARRCAALRAASCAALLRRAARGCWPRVAREGWVTPRR